MRVIPQTLVSSVLAFILVALVIGQPQPVQVQVVHERSIVQRIPGTNRTVYVTNRTCDTRTIERLLNEVARSSAITGDTKAINHADASADQSASAQSGDAVIGQTIRTLNICGSVTVNASNHVDHAKAITGDAEARNSSVAPSTDPPVSDTTPRPRTRDTAAPEATVGPAEETPEPTP